MSATLPLFRRPHWPLPTGLIAAVLLVGAAFLLAAIAVRRKSPFGGAIVFVFALMWNAGIVFAFMSPHNRHVIHLATHHASVVVNAAIGVLWLLGCVFCVVRWARSSSSG